MAGRAMVEEEEQGKGAALADSWEVRSPSMPLVHSQVRRIREEDLRIGAVAGEVLSERVMRFHLALHHSSFSADAALCFRAAALPASPLRNSRTALGSAWLGSISSFFFVFSLFWSDFLVRFLHFLYFFSIFWSDFCWSLRSYFRSVFGSYFPLCKLFVCHWFYQLQYYYWLALSRLKSMEIWVARSFPTLIGRQLRLSPMSINVHDFFGGNYFLAIDFSFPFNLYRSSPVIQNYCGFVLGFIVINLVVFPYIFYALS